MDINNSSSAKSKPSILLAIPARGGSKRLPRKNLAILNGKPMIAYSIEAALQSGLSDKVYVCTEDAEIASTARDYGATVFEVPESMTGDLVSSTVPCMALYDKLTANGEHIDYIATLQPTSPLRNSEDLKAAYQQLLQSKESFLLSLTPIDPHYFHWAFEEHENEWRMVFGSEYMKERPLLPEKFRPNGAIKIAKSDKLKETGNFLFHEYPIAGYIMPEDRSVHVATDFDITCTQALLAKGETI